MSALREALMDAAERVVYAACFAYGFLRTVLHALMGGGQR